MLLENTLKFSQIVRDFPLKKQVFGTLAHDNFISRSNAQLLDAPRKLKQREENVA